MTLANYQEKFKTLEKNYKKFTSNLVNPNQSDQIIEDLRYKNGLNIMLLIVKKLDGQDLRSSFKLWRLNSGLAQKMYENQEKTIILAKYAQKLHRKSLNYVKI